MGNIHQGPDHRPGHSLKYTSCNQPQVLADCRSELLAAESTRWSALVYWQPTRQVSPTTSAESTSCNQPQVLADCRSELLAAESTRWSALVLQPTRQVSPTTSAESIPDIFHTNSYTSTGTRHINMKYIFG
ncbi:unnamed protein product [Staurois parvus]|uniref:Uncharacterized protein n=1 Tax=Staurois parvus TaxID=386267 RepID=A0ABN9EAK9_9NEOB|nr:unnamed protein product [Staurois parvus]